MKSSKTCPFCDSTKIFIDKAEKNSTIWKMHDTTDSFYLVDRYICLNCGHIEEWVDKEYYEKHRETFKDSIDENNNLCIGSWVKRLYKDD